MSKYALLGTYDLIAEIKRLNTIIENHSCVDCGIMLGDHQCDGCEHCNWWVKCFNCELPLCYHHIQFTGKPFCKNCLNECKCDLCGAGKVSDKCDNCGSIKCGRCGKICC